MKIRKAKKEDIKRIDEIYIEGSIREGKLQFPKASLKNLKHDLDKYKFSRPKRFLNEIKSQRQHWIVAEENGVVVGFGQAWIKNKETGILEKVYLDKKWARRRIGSKILKELEKWLKSKRVEFIESGVYYKNVPSIKLNEKAGYKPISIKMQKKINN